MTSPNFSLDMLVSFMLIEKKVYEMCENVIDYCEN